MNTPGDLHRLQPAQRAQLIYATARARTDDALWRSLMNADLPAAQPSAPSRRSPLFGLDLEALLGPANHEGSTPPLGAEPAGSGDALSGLGPNARHGPALLAAASRTGIPPSALAAIVDAESGKRPDGSWNSMSRNPRSSAAGLGQFLSGTWIGEAERPGTWLNGVARERGWLDGRGRVQAGARGALLAMRYEPGAAIEATADYARSNLRRLERAGVVIGADPASVASAAYLSHHLGPGDAVRFLGQGLAPARAGHLLAAQVGRASAGQRIAAAGCPAAAHRQWLLSYVERHVRPDRFTA